MKNCEVVVNIKEDRDARPIAFLVQTASQFESKIYIDCEEKHVNAKSIMGMMTLALKNGDNVEVVTDGKDENDAAERIGQYLEGAEAAV